MTSFFNKDKSMKIISELGIQIPQVYLPQKGTDLMKWAVIACDQFTSQPEYWKDVEAIVGPAPSTLNLTFPEVYLEQLGGDARIQNVQTTMRKYMEEASSSHMMDLSMWNGRWRAR